MQEGAHRAGRVGVALLLSTLTATTLVVIAPNAPSVRAQEAPPATPSLGDGLDPGKIRYVAGVAARTGFSGDGGPATEALFNSPQGLDFDAAGNLYVVDFGNSRVRRIDAATGIVTTVAGGGPTTGFGDGGPANEAFLHYPTGVSVASNGDVYIADTTNQRIRKVDGTTGIITTIAGTGTALTVG